MPVLDRSLVRLSVDRLAEFGVRDFVMISDEDVHEPVASELLGSVGESLSIGFISRTEDTPLFRAIAHARRRLPPGPFALQFVDCASQRNLESQLAGYEGIGPNDGFVVMSRYSSTTEPVSEASSGEHAGGVRGGQAEHFAGFFLLGADFPISDLEPSERRTTPKLRTALDAMERSGGSIERRYLTGWWRYRGQADPVLDLNRFMVAGLESYACEGDVSESDLEGPIHCDPTATIEASVIRGPAFIGPRAEIRHAFVGPFSVVGSGASITGVEIENSVILEETQISYVGGRLDSSVVGPRARIFRDFRMPRGTRLHVGAGANISLQ